MTNKTIQFVPGATDAMRARAKTQYDKLLTEYGDFQVDCEAVDSMVSPIIPISTRIEIVNELGRAIWGLHPLLNSTRVDAYLPDMLRKLDAIVAWCDEGNEFDMWCDFDEATGEITFNDDIIKPF
jgi:hypothetical protein